MEIGRGLVNGNRYVYVTVSKQRRPDWDALTHEIGASDGTTVVVVVPDAEDSEDGAVVGSAAFEPAGRCV